jgi:tRNA (Thr-GGU) A37 N-methylase
MFKNPITHDELSDTDINYNIPQSLQDAADAQTDADAAAINDPISQTDETVATNDPNSQTNVEKFGVFRGRSMILPDKIAIQIVAKLREKGNKLSWLDKITFGEHKLEKRKITPNNYQKIHQDDVFSDINDLTEQQVRSYFLNYVVDVSR